MSCIDNIVTYRRNRQGKGNPNMRSVHTIVENAIGREEKHYSTISMARLTISPPRNPSLAVPRNVKRHTHIVYLLVPMCVMVLLLLVGLGGELLCGSGISSKDQSFALLLVGILLVSCGALYRKLFHRPKGETP